MDQRSNPSKTVWICLGAVGVAITLGAMIAAHNSPEQSVRPLVTTQTPVAAEPQQVVVPDAPPAPPPITFEADPQNNLPVYQVSELYELFRARHGEDPFLRKKIRLRGEVAYVGEDYVDFMSSRNFLTFNFKVGKFGDTELNPLREGDTIEVICDYTGNEESNHDPRMPELTWYFHGIELHKTS